MWQAKHESQALKLVDEATFTSSLSQPKVGSWGFTGRRLFWAIQVVADKS
jgi:hypothetical protein